MFDALFYGVYVFRTIQKRLPGVKMSGLVEVAVCDIRIFFEAYYIEDVVSVGDLPCVDVAGIFFPVVLEKECVPVALCRHIMRVARYRQGFLFFCLQEYLFIT